MKQLSVIDSAFINLEQENTPQHIGGLAVYDPSTHPEGKVRFKELIASFHARASGNSIFRTRLVEVPGNFERPFWVEDANYDTEFHVRHIRLPAPGDWRQLCIQVARLHARPLDMSKPLWEAYIIEGLDNIKDLPEGSFAIYTKMHHSLIDGDGAQAFITTLHDLEPNPLPVEIVNNPIEAEAVPSSAALIRKAIVTRAKHNLAVPKTLLELGKDVVQMGLEMRDQKIAPPDIQAPKTRFNRPVGKHRAVEATYFSLDDFKEVKSKLDVSINDVSLAVVSGAMRRYLDSLGELPSVSLAASIPMNMKKRRSAKEGENNQVGSMFCELHTDEADPITRIRKIHQSSSEAKEFAAASPMVDALKLAGVLSPAMTQRLAKLYTSTGLSKRMPVNTSTVVTNVPGPPFDLYCAGAKMVLNVGFGVLTPGVGLFHTIFSMAGKISFSVLADRDQLTDPAFYRECIDASFAEILEATRAYDPDKPRPKTKKPTARKAPAKKQPAKKTAAKKKAAIKAVPKKKAAARKKAAAKT